MDDVGWEGGSEGEMGDVGWGGGGGEGGREEGREGKGVRFRWWRYHEKQKQTSSR